MKCLGLSASKIKTIDLCKFKYYLQYHLDLDLGDSFPARKGSIVHEIFEAFAKDKKDGIEFGEIHESWFDKILKAYTDDKIWTLSSKAVQREKLCAGCKYNNDSKCLIVNMAIDQFPGCPKDEFEETIWLTEKVIKDKTPANPLTKKVIDVEERFEITIIDSEDQIPVVGYMDIVNEIDKDTIEITDYKTGNKVQSYSDCLNDPQFLIYHFVGRKIYPQYKNIIVTPYYLKSRPISLAFTDKDEKRTLMSIIRYWHKIKRELSPERIADKPDGKVVFNHICKYMCNIDICTKEHKKFVELGGIIRE